MHFCSPSQQKLQQSPQSTEMTIQSLRLFTISLESDFSKYITNVGAQFLTDFGPQCSKFSTQKMNSINMITKYLLLCLTEVCFLMTWLLIVAAGWDRGEIILDSKDFISFFASEIHTQKKSLGVTEALENTTAARKAGNLTVSFLHSHRGWEDSNYHSASETTASLAGGLYISVNSISFPSCLYKCWNTKSTCLADGVSDCCHSASNTSSTGPHLSDYSQTLVACVTLTSIIF